MLSPGEDGSSYKGHLKMRSAVGAPVANAAVIEVEMTKGTLELQLPGRTESPERSKRRPSVVEVEGWWCMLIHLSIMQWKQQPLER